MKNINAIYTSQCPTSSIFQKIIYPQLRKQIPVWTKETIYLTECVDTRSDFFSISARMYADTIYYLDYRHWYYDDTVFEKYCKKTTELKPKYLSVFDNPFDYERPWKVDYKTFSVKLQERTNILVDIIKTECPETLLIAPKISVLFHDFKEVYKNYLDLNADKFDFFSVLCANDMSDICIGDISSTLIDLNKNRNKPILLFTSIPCKISEDTKIDRNTNHTFKPFTDKEAEVKLNQIYLFFTYIQKDVKLFYFGIDKDQYNPNIEPNSFDFWNNTLPVNVHINDYVWNWYHYLGLCSYDDKVKVYLLKSLLDLAKNYNV